MATKLSGPCQNYKQVTQFSTQRLALIALLSALAYIGRLVCQPFPNIQPVTVIIILITMYMGWLDGVCVAVLSILLSNMLMGMGPWTIAQILTYMLLVSVTCYVSPCLRQGLSGQGLRQQWKMVVFSGFLGLLYGFVISIFSYRMFGLTQFWPYYLQGIPFDMMHALGNSIFYVLLHPLLTPLILKFMRNQQNNEH